MITINDCLNFKHKYEITPAEGHCPINAMPPDVLNQILSYLWIGSRTNEVCKGWNEYFVEVLKQDLVVWSILARVLKWNHVLPESRALLAVRRKEVAEWLSKVNTSSLELYERFFEYVVKSSYFENIFSLARHNCSEISILVRINDFDQVFDCNVLKGIPIEDGQVLCARQVFRGDVEKALKFANSWENEDVLLEIAKALFRIGHFSRSLEMAKKFAPKEKGCVYGMNAFWLLQLGEEEIGMTLANMTPEDGSCAKVFAAGAMAASFLSYGHLDKACEMMERMLALTKDMKEEASDVHRFLIELSQVFNRRREREDRLKMLEECKHIFIGLPY